MGFFIVRVRVTIRKSDICNPLLTVAKLIDRNLSIIVIYMLLCVHKTLITRGNVPAESFRIAQFVLTVRVPNCCPFIDLIAFAAS